MIIGVDVGGTNTDVAIIDEDRNLMTYKYPNEYGITNILKEIDRNIDIKSARLVISTSLPLNIIASRFNEIKTCSLVIPGPGLNYSDYGIILKGAVNHRGDIVENIDKEEVEKVLSENKAQTLAISAKFSIRNPQIEYDVLKISLKYFDRKDIALSNYVGFLNFPLRINTTIVNAKIMREVWELTDAIRKFTENFFYYKGDGGIIPWQVALRNPSELYNSSPAAVAYGAYYLTKEENALVIDIGGTTTDFILIRDGAPEIEERVKIHGKRTHIRCVKSFSIPYGGDSLFDGELKPYRIDKPIAFGGKHITLTDLLNGVGEEVGNFRESRKAVKGIDCERYVDYYIDMIAKKAKEFDADKIIGTGYLARYLIPEIAKRCGKKFIVPKHSESANAVGVAVSRISLTLYARFDTERSIAVYNGEVNKETFEKVSGHPDDEEIINSAINKAKELAANFGANEEDLDDVDILYFSSFPIVRGGIMRGKIADVIVQIKPGLSSNVL